MARPWCRQSRALQAQIFIYLGLHSAPLVMYDKVVVMVGRAQRSGWIGLWIVLSALIAQGCQAADSYKDGPIALSGSARAQDVKSDAGVVTGCEATCEALRRDGSLHAVDCGACAEAPFVSARAIAECDSDAPDAACLDAIGVVFDGAETVASCEMACEELHEGSCLTDEQLNVCVSACNRSEDSARKVFGTCSCLANESCEGAMSCVDDLLATARTTTVR